jgi:hypothetical protein
MVSIGEKPDGLTPIDRDDRDASLVGVFNTNLANFTIDRRNTPVYCKIVQVVSTGSFSPYCSSRCNRPAYRRGVGMVPGYLYHIQHILQGTFAAAIRSYRLRCHYALSFSPGDTWDNALARW